MQIVIDIPEEVYIASQILNVKYEDVIQIPLECISKGTPLPKEHGDLIDRSEAIISLFDYYNGKKTVGQCIDEVQTIIESDKAVHDADSD